MKARVKTTGKIVEVQPLYEPDEYITDKGVYYDILEIELLDEYSPDYWTRLEHQYAIGAMQGMLSNPTVVEAITESKATMERVIPCHAYRFATALVEELKEKEERK